MRHRPMSDPHAESATPKAGAARTARLAIVVAMLALVLTAAQWFTAISHRSAERSHAGELAKTQNRINTLESRLQRERADLDRMSQKIGQAAGGEDPLAERVTRLEQELSRAGSGAGARGAWLIEQAGYFMRIANTHENLGGNTAGALAALLIADDYLRDAADPRLAGVRKRIAEEIAALRMLPRVDLEGLVLKLGALGKALEQLPHRQEAPAGFTPAPVALPGELTATEKAKQALGNALRSIVSLRRSDEPSATLLSEQAAQLLMRSMDLELQLARLALIRGDAAIYRAALANVTSQLQRYFDTDATEVVAAQALLAELAAVPLPDTLPDISGSLTEFLRIQASEPAP
jgi:uroporphyrin-III C-methyltransferase